MKKFLALRPAAVLPEGVFKDFEGIYVPAFQRQSHFLVSRGRLPLDNEAGPERTSLL
jgi:hypothetical protein